jgi:SRSO17 transposase
MADLLDDDGQQRLESYFDDIGKILGDVRRKASFSMYCMGLMLEGDRKSMEPIAARLSGTPDAAERAHDHIQHMLTDGKWSDRDVRRYAAGKGVTALIARGPVRSWILDDTGFLKQGSHSVGVQRQYTGSAGKTANCQVAVSLTIATATDHVPVDFEIYLPEPWANDPKRRAEAKIPEGIEFRTKLQLAMVIIDRAIEDGIPKGVVLEDSAYGNSSDFRYQLRSRGLDYAVGVKPNTKAWRIDSRGRRRGEPISIGDLARQLGPKAFRRSTWKEGTNRSMHSRFARLRVVPFHDDGVHPAEREDVWLVIEWPTGEAAPTDYTFATMPRKMPMQRLVRTFKERWRTERVYEDLKGELGLDHYEGRRYPGWNHHISCVLACNAFIQSERLRAFPPSASWTRRAPAHRRSTGAPLRRFLHHGTPRDRPHHVSMDATLSDLSFRSPDRAAVCPSRKSDSRR